MGLKGPQPGVLPQHEQGVLPKEAPVVHCQKGGLLLQDEVDQSPYHLSRSHLSRSHLSRSHFAAQRVVPGWLCEQSPRRLLRRVRSWRRRPALSEQAVPWRRGRRRQEAHCCCRSLGGHKKMGSPGSRGEDGADAARRPPASVGTATSGGMRSALQRQERWPGTSLASRTKHRGPRNGRTKNLK